jgi:hypothetical protein
MEFSITIAFTLKSASDQSLNNIDSQINCLEVRIDSTSAHSVLYFLPIMSHTNIIYIIYLQEKALVVQGFKDYEVYC